MQEGWHGEEYLVLFDVSEVPHASVRYGIASSLSGYEVLGLRGWDDLIVRDPAGLLFTVPTIPAVPIYLEPFQLPDSGTLLKHDPRFTGRIKWYVTPIVFGGDPEEAENLTWVDHEQHSQLVQWWNDKFRELANEKPEP
jgi:hypothetical protein